MIGSCHGITLDSTELLGATHSFTSDWRSNLHSWVLDFPHLWSWKGLEHLNPVIWMGEWILLTIYSSYLLMLTLHNFTQSPSSYTNTSYDGTLTVWKEQCSGGRFRASELILIYYQQKPGAEQMISLVCIVFSMCCFYWLTHGALSDFWSILQVLYILSCQTCRDLAFAEPLLKVSASNRLCEADVHIWSDIWPQLFYKEL